METDDIGISKPLYRTGNIIESDSPHLPSIQVRSSHCDERTPNTRPIVGLDICDVGSLTGQEMKVIWQINVVEK